MFIFDDYQLAKLILFRSESCSMPDIILMEMARNAMIMMI